MTRCLTASSPTYSFAAVHTRAPALNSPATAASRSASSGSFHIATYRAANSSMVVITGIPSV